MQLKNLLFTVVFLGGFLSVKAANPTANNVIGASQPNIAGTIKFIVPTLNGNDLEDGVIAAGGTVIIVSLPANGILYYSGVAVTIGQVITSYAPNRLTVDPNSGSVTLSFDYRVRDSNGNQSANATVTMPFTLEGFACDGLLRLTRQVSGNTILSYPTITGNALSVNTSNQYNGVLLNASVYYKGYIYAFQSNTLYELHADNSVSTFTIANLPANSYNNAGVTLNGLMYVLNGYTLYTIDLNTKALVGNGITMSGISDAGNQIWGDVAVAPGGSIFAWYHPTAAANTAPKGLYKLNPVSGVFSKVGQSVGQTIGSMMFDNTGKLYAYGSAILNGTQNRFYYIDTITGLTTQIGNPDVSVSQSDGCSCPFSISMEESSTSACLNAGNIFDYVFKIDNNTGGATLSDINFSDTLDARFSWNYTTPATLNALVTSLKAVYGPAVTVQLKNAVKSGVAGINNEIVISNMTIPKAISNFSLSVKTNGSASFTSLEAIGNRAYLLNLPGTFGNSLGSDDPNTSATSDNTIIGNPVIDAIISVGTINSCQTVLTASLASNAGASYTYQWKLNGVDIPGANAKSYTANGPGGPYTVTASSTQGCVSAASPSYTVGPCVGGTVYDDANGILAPGLTIDGIGTGTLSGTQLYATIINNSNIVVQSSPVLADGTFSFPNLTPNANYAIRVSINGASAGDNTLPAVALPTGWVQIGEYLGAGAGNDGTANGILTITVANASVTNAKFGVDSRPTANSAVGGGQVNPGGTIFVPVPSTLFSGSDIGDLNSTGMISSIRISAFPSNITSIKINGVTYTGAAAFNAAFPTGAIIPTNAAGNPTQAIEIDPATGTSTAVISYYVIDNAGVESSASATVSMPFSGLTIGGTVFNDANGTNNSLIDGTGIGSPSSTQLYMYLISGTTVFNKATLSSTGIYSFASVSAGTYSLVLSSANVAVGAATPAATLPAGWVNTAEGTAGTGDGNNNGIVSGITISTVGLGGINFGIDALPTPVSATAASQVNPGGTNSAAVAASVFGGTDAVDAGSAGHIDSIRITSFPANATSITINGTLYTSVMFAAAFPTGAKIPTNFTGQPLWPILVDPSFNGAGSVDINYVVVDNASKASTSTAIASIPFTDLTIGGSVYDDANGKNNSLIDGVLISSPGGSPLYAKLVNHLTQVVLGVVPVQNGMYTLGTANGVQLNGLFDIIISTTQATTSAVLPAGWVYTSEAVSPAFQDGNDNGNLALPVITGLLAGVNFGIDKLPVAVNKMANFTSVVANTKYPLNDPDTPPLEGSDAEDGIFGSGNSFLISSLPANGKLYYNGELINLTDVTNGTGTALITNYIPALLEFSFDKTTVISTSFTYKAMDAAGKYSVAATYTLNALMVLPLANLQLQAQKSATGIMLDWTTLSNEYSNSFEIESSQDAIHFRSIGTMNAVPNQPGTYTYHLLDTDTRGTMKYYRVKMLDRNGKTLVSNMVVIRLGNISAIQVFPNPAKKNVFITFAEAGNYQIDLVNAAGQVVIRQQTQVASSLSANVERGNLPAGMYMLRILCKDNNKATFIKLVLE